MGVGKTTVGISLEKKLVDSIYIEGDSGWNGIPFVINDKNKQKVLDNIVKMIKSALKCEKYQIVILGWVMDHQDIIDGIISKIDLADVKLISISLICSEETIIERLNRDLKDGKRTDIGVVERSLQRLPLFEKLKTIKIDTSFLTIEEITNLVSQMAND